MFLRFQRLVKDFEVIFKCGDGDGHIEPVAKTLTSFSPAAYILRREKLFGIYREYA
jgi:hypothetical protein